MDHDLAIKTYAADRYLLGELTEAEIEEYEDHFFSCPACAQEVKLTSEFIAGAREVFKTGFEAEAKPVRAMSTAWGRFWGSIRQPVPALACAALVMAIGFGIYQNGVIQELQKPEVLTGPALMLRASRGPAEAQAREANHQPFRIAFQVPAGSYKTYEGEILDGSSASRYSFGISAQQAEETIQLKFPGGSLPAGSYTLVIRGVNSSAAENPAKKEVARYSFSVNVQN